MRRRASSAETAVQGDLRARQFLAFHNRKAAQVPKSDRDYWGPNLEHNRLRDKQNLDALSAAGWQSTLIWECEIKNAPAVALRTQAFLTAKLMRRKREGNH
jgi:G:T-mismatch repair DNA endonuclease (very short patch repair protein)